MVGVNRSRREMLELICREWVPGGCRAKRRPVPCTGGGYVSSCRVQTRRAFLPNSLLLTGGPLGSPKSAQSVFLHLEFWRAREMAGRRSSRRCLGSVTKNNVVQCHSLSSGRLTCLKDLNVSAVVQWECPTNSLKMGVGTASSRCERFVRGHIRFLTVIKVDTAGNSSSMTRA